MRPIEVAWFNSARGCVGVVLVQGAEGTRAYISAVEGKDERADVDFVMMWGAQFPVDAAKAIFKSKGM